MTEHTHDWYLELVPAYAIGAADANERRALDEHVQACAECRALVADYRAIGEDLLYAAPLAAAPFGLTENVRKKMLTGEESPTRSRRSFLHSPAFALGLIALALLILTNVYWAGRVGALEQRARQIAALAQAPGISLPVADDGYGDAPYRGSGVVYLQPDSDVALLCVYAMPDLGPTRTYQAWLIHDGERVSAGTFNVGPNGYGVLLIDAPQPLGGYQQLGITVEPAGGSLEPTTPRIMGGEL